MQLTEYLCHSIMNGQASASKLSDYHVNVVSAIQSYLDRQ